MLLPMIYSKYKDNLLATLIVLSVGLVFVGRRAQASATTTYKLY
jgi:hypothetical protein